MKKIVYLGYLVTPEEANRVSGASVAGNKMQWNVIKNLGVIEGIDVSCVTVTPLASYPRDKKIYQQKEEQTLFQNVNVNRISYLNFPIVKQLWQIVNVYRTAKKMVIKEKADTVFCFNLFPQIGIPMRWLKRKFPYLDTVCLLADLPIDDNTERKGVSVWLRNIMEKSTWKSMKICDKYIVLNKEVIRKYLPNKEYIVIDGGVSDDDVKKYEDYVGKNEEHSIMYCGALTEYNGILNLLQAMQLVKDEDIYLDIYGGGYLEDVVRSAAQQRRNIRYHGRVDNQTIIKKQREAWLLINPRVINDPIAEVTFPSKTFEYMLSGTPVLTTKLNGYSEEYEGKMIFTESDSAEKIAEGIEKVKRMGKEELQSIGCEAKKFVVEKRCWSGQSKKIADFIEGNGPKGE